MRRLAMAMVLVAGLGTGAVAAPPQESDPAARVLGGLRACRTLADADRLACYDRAAAALDQAVQTKEVTLIDKQEVRRTRRGLFGFNLPRIGLFSSDGDDQGEKEGFTEINSTIASARAVENNRVEFRLTDEGDAVWRTTDPGYPPKAGSTVRIRKGTLGNYFVRFNNERGVRGMRIR